MRLRRSSKLGRNLIWNLGWSNAGMRLASCFFFVSQERGHCFCRGCCLHHEIDGLRVHQR